MERVIHFNANYSKARNNYGKFIDQVKRVSKYIGDKKGLAVKEIEIKMDRVNTIFPDHSFNELRVILTLSNL